MNQTIKITLTDLENNQHDFLDIISVQIQKEYFTPYTSASVSVNASSEFNEYKDISIYIGTHKVHFGLIDTADLRTESGRSILSITSKSFTSLLVQNQPVPGMIYNVSLDTLMESFSDIPNITYENNGVVQNYIFLREDASLWDAIVNISYKISGIYPFIRNNNDIRISYTETPSRFTVNPESIISFGKNLDYTKIVSDFHMQDIDDNYNTYFLNNTDAVKRNIIRHKQIPLDRQYLSDPYQSMLNRINYSMRGHHSQYIEYAGFNGEDINDIFNEKRIDRITITASSGFIKTKIFSYFI